MLHVATKLTGSCDYIQDIILLERDLQFSKKHTCILNQRDNLNFNMCYDRVG